MPELTTLLVIGGISAVLFGGGVVTAVRLMTGRKASKGDD